MGMLKLLGLKARRCVFKSYNAILFSTIFFKFFLIFASEPYVTEDELKLMLRGAELSGAIEEEEQVCTITFGCFIYKRHTIICKI